MNGPAIQPPSAAQGLLHAAWRAAEPLMLDTGADAEQRTAARSLFHAGAIAMHGLLRHIAAEEPHIVDHLMSQLEAEIALTRASDPYLLPVKPAANT